MPVHPHACGEQSSVNDTRIPIPGSSPRVWGTDRCQDARGTRSRFIPTRVGNRSGRATPDPRPTVHPHACGEQSTLAEESPTSLGSSPRVWGTGRRQIQRRLQRRFIPTRVGNRRPVEPVRPAPPVHPHACGEQITTRRRLLPLDGSSPRVWGTGHAVGARRRAVRFIPTRVGNRLSGLFARVWMQVHPHACGEQTSPASEYVSTNGSSPRVWGTADRRVGASGSVRFIPTRVGNSTTAATARPTATVHPHACGEQLVVAGNRVEQVGSSPRVWGTEDHLDLPAVHERFIPTRVGNSGCAPVH